MLIVGSTGPERGRARRISGLEAWSPPILGLARIMAGLQFLEHGLMKLAHFPAPYTETSPPFEDVRNRLEAMDQYYVELAERLSIEELNETIRFEYVGGGDGAMTRQEIMLHLVNHATYHRGFISVMLYQVPFMGDADDLSVFLRDVWARPQR